jgi:plastocyanin
MNRNNYVVLGVIVIILIIAAALIYSNRSAFSPATTNPSNSPTSENLIPTSESASPSATVTGKVDEITVTSSNFKFTPAVIRVNQNDTVKITLKNTQASHSWNVETYEVSTPVINAGQQATVTFVADKKGTFEYYCSVDGHRQMGMVGQLIVQ